jgi:hypothetical protein
MFRTVLVEPNNSSGSTVTSTTLHLSEHCWFKLFTEKHSASGTSENLSLTGLLKCSNPSPSLSDGDLGSDLDRYKGCWMVQYFNTQFPLQLESTLRNLQNVWHQYQYHPSSIPFHHFRVRWWRCQSHSHSWREVSQRFIPWFIKCAYLLYSLCWTLDIWSAGWVCSYDMKVSPSRFLIIISRQLYWHKLIADGRFELSTISGLDL